MRLSEEQIFDTLVPPYLNHAVRMYEATYASAADIDAAMRFGCGYPQGPLATIDELGAGSVCDRLLARHERSGDPLHRPTELLAALAAGGRTFAEEAPAVTVAPPRLRHAIGVVGVVGTGTMAAGIAQVFAQRGYDVVQIGRSQHKLDGVVAGLTRSLDKAIAKGRLDEEGKRQVLGRLTGATEREALDGVDIVVEAVAEELDVKLPLYADLDRICSSDTILATTTSSLPITKLAHATSRPESVIGMHFFNPAPVMRLVEVVTTEATAPDVDETVRALCASIDKVAVSCGDRAGFIVNCLLFPYLNDAIALHQDGEPLERIDHAIKEQAGIPMGPFELLDVVGTDVSLAIQRELHAEFGEPGFAPAALLEQKVTSGALGRKAGRGFYAYR